MKEVDLEPDIGPFEFYLDAFRELSTCRMSGMALGPIPFTAIVEYSRLYEIGVFEDFNYILRRMDLAFMDAENKKTSKGESKSNGKSNPGKANPNKR